jgi:hypothetical protein
MTINKELKKIYQLSNSYKINYVRVINPLLSKIYNLTRTKFNGEEYNDQLFGRFLMPLRYIIFEMSTSLKPYNELIDEVKLDELREHIKSIGKVYSDKEEYTEILDLLLKILSSNRNLICEYITKNIIIHSSQIHAVVTKREIKDCEKNHFKKVTGVENIIFHTEKTFKQTTKSFDYVIFLGNENHFDYSFNNVPRAPVSYYLAYDLYYNKFTNNSMFSHFSEASYHSSMYLGLTKEYKDISFYQDDDTFSKNIKNENDEEEPIFTIEEPTISSGILQDTISKISKNDETEVIDVTPLEISQGRFILLANNIRKHEVLTNTREIEKEYLINITIGDYLLIRNQSETTLIRNVANELFNNSNIAEYRDMQKKLKKYLRRLLEKYGGAKLCLIFKKKGLDSINEMKINHLIKEESFKLQNNKEYATLLLILTKGNERVAQKYYDASRKLAAFHIQTGRIISRELRKKIKEVDLSPLYETGSQTIELPEYKGASFTLEKIINIGTETYSVPSSQEKKIIKYNI